MGHLSYKGFRLFVYIREHYRYASGQYASENFVIIISSVDNTRSISFEKLIQDLSNWD